MILFAVAIVLAVYIGILILAAWVSVHPFRTPCFLSMAQLGVNQESVSFEADGNVLRGWWMPVEDARSAVILVHGYMMNRSEMAPEAYALWKRGVSCLIFEMRAHGRSDGKVCTLGHRERDDIRASVNFVRSRIPHAKIGVIGSSMGAAATALAMGDDPLLLDAAVLDSAYSRLPSAILGWWRFLGGETLRWLFAPTLLFAWPMVGFNTSRIDVSSALERVTIPLLFFHGESDPLALPDEARRNFAAAAGPKKIVWFEKCGHSEGRWEYAERYHEALITFFGDLDFFAPELELTTRESA